MSLHSFRTIFSYRLLLYREVIPKKTRAVRTRTNHPLNIQFKKNLNRDRVIFIEIL